VEKLKVLAMSGSLRKDSYNRKILKVAIKFAEESGAEAKEIDLKELSLPLYDEDIESIGIPETVRILKNAISDSDVLIISTPEYNHSISGALKNAIDWASRSGNSFSGKSAVIFGVSTGIYGTLRAQFHLRQILNALNVYVQPQPQIFISSIDKSLDDSGRYNNKIILDQLNLLIIKTLKYAAKDKE
jgi:chromate reductase, NAD(P)H dehydrogenase (quinone)